MYHCKDVLLVNISHMYILYVGWLEETGGKMGQLCMNQMSCLSLPLNLAFGYSR